jgi:hypothetical protein
LSLPKACRVTAGTSAANQHCLLGLRRSIAQFSDTNPAAGCGLYLSVVAIVGFYEVNFFMERIAVFKTDLLFNACSRCSAWPMSANVAESKWGNQKISFRCSHCGHQETMVTKIKSQGRGAPAAASKRDRPC